MFALTENKNQSVGIKGAWDSWTCSDITHVKRLTKALNLGKVVAHLYSFKLNIFIELGQVQLI